MSAAVAAVFFAGVPAVLVGGLAHLVLGEPIGLIAGVAMFGFGLDVCLRGHQ